MGKSTHSTWVRPLVDLDMILAGSLVFRLGIAVAMQFQMVPAGSQLSSGKAWSQMFPTLWTSEAQTMVSVTLSPVQGLDPEHTTSSP